MQRVAPFLLVVLLVAGLAPAAAAGTGTSSSGDFPDEYHDSTVLVRVGDDADADAVHELVGVGDVVSSLSQIGVDVVEVVPGTVAVAVAAYEAVPAVDFAEPNYLQRPHAAEPNDPLLDEQYGLERIDALEGWGLYDPDGTFAPAGGATLAVLDSGIDLAHPEFAGKIVDCRTWLTATGTGAPGCQENNVHGTHVSGIAAAIADNAEGIAGVGYDADLMALQVCTLVCFTADSSAAILYAADNGADVTNMSFGGSAPSATAEAATMYAADRGVLQVSSAGNSGPDDDTVGYPAGYDDVMAVSATGRDDRIADFSSRGPQVDVAAPGVDILSTLPGAGAAYGELSGTSMSSPHVAGLGALLRNIGLDAEQARQAIVAGADLVDGAQGRTDEYGAGRINVADSIAVAADMLDGDERPGQGGGRPAGPGARP